MTPNILFEDNEIMVIEKPAGMVVNKADTVKGVKTVQEWAERKLKVEGEESDFSKRGGIVHRLDKETSGILIIAKTEESFFNLQRQFKEGRVEKTYIALVHGKVVPEEGEINVPIGRLPWNRMRFGVFPQGRESRSLYKVLGIKYLVSEKGKELLSLVEVYPKTGRTHQIRVHFLYQGNPLFADELYGGRKQKKADRKLLPRHFLHATKIKFFHPKSGAEVEFESSLPPDLANFLSQLQ